MTKPKSAPKAAPVAAAEADTPAAEVASPTDAVAAAEAHKADGQEVSVTTTGRVKIETQIKVEDFTEGGEASPDIYSREPKVTKVDLGGGRFIENYE